MGRKDTTDIYIFSIHYTFTQGFKAYSSAKSEKLTYRHLISYDLYGRKKSWKLPIIF